MSGAASGQSDGDLRLADGDVDWMGRVEVYYGSHPTIPAGWGTVCENLVVTTDIRVMCGQLGYRDTVVGEGPYGHFPVEGNVPIWLDDLTCDGDEARLADCSHRGWGVHNCFHEEDLVVGCDLPGLVLSEARLEVAEADQAGASYTVSLENEPAENLAVDIEGERDGDLSVSPSEFTFTATEWETQTFTVTVTARSDVDRLAEDEILTHRMAGGLFDNYVGTELPVSIADSDADNAVEVSHTSVAVEEGDADGVAYTLSLNNAPKGGDAVVTVSGAEGTSLTVSPTSLTFTAGNYATEQTVTVEVAEDENLIAETVTLEHSVRGGSYDALPVASFEVRVLEPLARRVVVVPAALTLTESDPAGGKYTVALDGEPVGAVAVALSASAGSELSLSPSNLTFTTENWDQGQTVTVTAGSDEDSIDDTATITHSPGGGGYDGVAAATLTVTVNDREGDFGARVTPGGLSIHSNLKGTYEIALTGWPESDVTVTVGGFQGRRVTPTPARLTFTPDNWYSAQTVSVSTSVDDDGDPFTVTLTHSGAGGGYDGVSLPGIPVRVGPLDGSIRLVDGESDSMGRVEIYYGSHPSVPAGWGTVCENLIRPTEIRVICRQLGFRGTQVLEGPYGYFPPTGNVPIWLDNTRCDGDEARLADCNHAGWGVHNCFREEDLMIECDLPRLELSETALQVVEEDRAGASYTLSLSREPTSDVVVAIAPPLGPDDMYDEMYDDEYVAPDVDLTLSPSELTFTTTDWGMRTITVTAASDDNTMAETVVVNHGAKGGGYSFARQVSLTVNIEDDDTPGLSASPASVTVDEGGSETYTVRLDTRPTADVTVTASVPPDSGLRVSPASLTFSADDYGEKTLTVSAAHDEDAGDGSVTLRHGATGGDYGDVADLLVPVTVLDDDPRGATLGRAALEVDEGGSETYTVRLDTRPTANVTVTASASSDSGLTLSPASLTFTAADYAVAQTVTVRVGHDEDAQDRTETVTHTATGGDYDSVSVDSVVATVRDDDVQGVTLGRAALEVDEGGSETYTVRLDTRPTADVSVTASVPPESGVTLSPASLTFMAADYAVAQTVTVRAGHDEDAEDGTATLRHGATGGDYGSVAVDDVRVTVRDDDTAAIALGAESLGVVEGQSAEYTVALEAQPSATVTVAATVPSESGVTVSPSVLTFTAADYAVAQTVTVRAEDDADTASETATVAHRGNGGGYGEARATLEVTVTDDDTPGVTLGATRLTLLEGATAEYTVRLVTEPEGTVTVTATVPSDSGVTLSPSVLTFTTEDYAVAQTVTVSAAEDEDAEDGAVTVAHGAAGGGYGGVAVGSVEVVVEDTHTAGVTLGRTALEVEEGESATYTLRLDTQPSSAVTVTTSVPEGAGLAVSPSVLTFTAADYAVAQTVTVSAAEDEDAQDTSATLAHGAAGGGYDGVAIDLVVVRVSDDDSPGVTLDVATLALNEGDSAAYTVRLDTRPTADVTVTASVPSGSGLTASPAALTFTAADYATAQTVTLRAAHDEDGRDETATLTHTARGGDYGGVRIAALTVRVNDDDSLAPPALVGTMVQDARLTLSYDRAIDEDSVPAAEDFDVSVDPSTGQGANVAGGPGPKSMQRIEVLGVEVAGAEVTLTLSRAVQPGERLNVSYTPGTNPIRSVSGVAAPALTGTSVMPQGTSGSGTLHIVHFDAAANEEREGFVRVINRSGVSGEVRIVAVDEAGRRSEAATLSIAAGTAVHFNSRDLEQGNADKGLAPGVGEAGIGDWRLELESTLDIEALAYARTDDGFVTAVHAIAPVVDGAHRVVFFNPASNRFQESRLRLVNPSQDEARVVIGGLDDAGEDAGRVELAVPAGETVELGAAALESGEGEGIEGGALGDGRGKWRLTLESSTALLVASLVRSAGGYLTNMSSAPATPGSGPGSLGVPLFPAAGGERQGFVRVINRSEEAGTVSIQPYDDSNRDYAPLTLALDARAAVHINSEDLEKGNPDKRLAGGTGAGAGNWRLDFESALDLEVLAYLRTPHDGFVTSVHDVAPVDGDVHRVVFFNPGSNRNQVSLLALVNTGSADAAVTVSGTDDTGESPGSAVRLGVPAGTVLMPTAAELESGEGAGIEGGALGDGAGKWRLAVTADRPILVMSLLRSPTGHLTSVSSVPGRDDAASAAGN